MVSFPYIRKNIFHEITLALLIVCLWVGLPRFKKKKSFLTVKTLKDGQFMVQKNGMQRMVCLYVKVDRINNTVIYLLTGIHKNFILTLQFKQEANGNSGVFFRSQIPEGVKISGWQAEVGTTRHAHRWYL